MTSIPVTQGARKFALVSQQLLDNLKADAQRQALTETPEFKNARRLATDIKAVLEDPNLTPDDKVQLYAKVLNEFNIMSKKAPEIPYDEHETSTADMVAPLIACNSGKLPTASATASYPATTSAATGSTATWYIYSVETSAQ